MYGPSPFIYATSAHPHRACTSVTLTVACEHLLLSQLNPKITAISHKASMILPIFTGLAPLAHCMSHHTTTTWSFPRRFCLKD